MDQWLEMIGQITDEKSFMRFLAALREDCENHDRDCNRSWRECSSAQHWETRSTGSFLRSMEDWGGGDFIEGRHHGDPILRRVATMLYVGRFLRPDDRPY
jgi:hypothetical protein